MDLNVNSTEFSREKSLLKFMNILSKKSVYIYPTFLFAMSPIGLLGNWMIIYALVSNGSYGKSLKNSYKASSRRYVICLSCISFIICFANIISAGLFFKRENLCTEKMTIFAAVWIGKYAQFHLNLFLNMSNYILCLIAIRNFIAIKYPILYKLKFENVPMNWDWLLLLLITIISLIFGIPSIWNKSIIPTQDGHHHHKYYLFRWSKGVFTTSYNIFNLSVMVFFPNILMIIFNILTWYLMYKWGKAKNTNKSRHDLQNRRTIAPAPPTVLRTIYDFDNTSNSKNNNNHMVSINEGIDKCANGPATQGSNLDKSLNWNKNIKKHLRCQSFIRHAQGIYQTCRKFKKNKQINQMNQSIQPIKSNPKLTFFLKKIRKSNEAQL
ncbi:unnamed protein product [Gordionus sp. m RMFG-2023]